MPDTELPPGSSFAYDLGEKILASQSARVDAIDTKAAVVMGVAGVLAGFLLRGPFQAAPKAVILLASVSLLVSLSFWTGKYSKAPDFSAVTERIQGTESWIKWRFLPNVADAIKANDRKLQRKGLFLTVAISGLLVLVLNVGGYLLSTLLCTGLIQ